MAAVSAADLGASVVWVEKNAGPITWAGEIGAYNTKLMNDTYGFHCTQEALNEIINDICRYASYEVDQRLVSLWVNESGRTMDWFIEKMEAKGCHVFIETDMRDTLYMNKVQTHTVYKEEFKTMGPNVMGSQVANPVLIEYADERCVNRLFEHTACQLLQDGATGRVTGIIVQRNADGAYLQINAAKSVILSTGGYSGNPDMMRALRYRGTELIANNFGGSFALESGKPGRPKGRPEWFLCMFQAAVTTDLMPFMTVEISVPHRDDLHIDINPPHPSPPTDEESAYLFQIS